MSRDLENDLLLRALMRQPVPRTPVWIMRQAGRYLPEYREVRARAGDFMSLCRNTELACEVTMQPLRRFRLDAAILFSDILTIPDAMGLGLYFSEGEGPRFERVIRSEKDVRQLARPDPEDELGYVMDAVRAIREALAGSLPLIGFAGSPWTLATYMVEGGSSKVFARVRGMLYESPGTMHALLGKLADSVTAYLNAQVRAGAQALMIFDTWGGTLSTDAYREFSLEYMRRIVDGLQRESEGRVVPVILFTKNGGTWLEDLAASGCDALGIDWTQPLAQARARVGEKVSLQGNMDPCVLYASPEVIRSQVRRVLEDFGPGEGHVFNLGHGVHPAMKPEHIEAMLDAVHELSPEFHLAPTD